MSADVSRYSIFEYSLLRVIDVSNTNIYKISVSGFFQFKIFYNKNNLQIKNLRF